MSIRKVSQALLFLIPALLLECNKEESYVPRPYSRIVLHDNIDQSEEGIIFNLEIIAEGNSEVTEVGLVWSKNSTPTITSARMTLKEFKKIGKFNHCCPVKNSRLTIGSHRTSLKG